MDNKTQQYRNEMSNLAILKYFFSSYNLNTSSIIRIFDVIKLKNKISAVGIFNKSTYYYDASDEEYLTWLKDVLHGNDYNINIFNCDSINDVVDDKFKLFYLDRDVDLIYFVDRFQPEYHFDQMHLQQVANQVNAEFNKYAELVYKSETGDDLF